MIKLNLKLDANSVAAQLLDFYQQPALTKVVILAKAFIERDASNQRAHLIRGIHRAAHAARNSRFFPRSLT